MIQSRFRSRLFSPAPLLAVCLATICLSSIAAVAAETTGKLTVTFVALREHGTATILQSPSGRFYVIDTGSSRGDYDAGRDAIGTWLKSQGIEEIEALVISHPHGDHYGGAVWLLDHFRVKALIDSGYEGRGQSDAYRAIRQHAVERGAGYSAVHAGARLAWDPAITVEVLSPPREFLLQDADPAKVSEHSVLNNNSLVLRVEHGENVFLFPGDAYGSEGSYLLRHWPAEKLRADVLSAPHHGFNSTPGYAAVVRPAVVVASCLAHYENSEIASPGDQARKIFEPVGAKVYSTAEQGSVRVVSDGRDLVVER